MSQNKNIRIKSRVDTKANWESPASELLDKEIGYEKETGRYKIGDGVSHWNDLPYASDGAYVLDENGNVEFSGNIKAKDIYSNNNKIITNIVNGTKKGSMRAQTAAKEENGYLVGYDSVALNTDTMAAGPGALGNGYGTKANGNYSHAEGYQTQAIGNKSHSEGEVTKANGETSHAEGYNTQTTARWAHAEGASSQATGEGSHVEGIQNYTSGRSSHAEGTNSKAYGNSSHSEGGGCETHADYAHAEGNGTKAEGQAAHSEGYKTCAKSLDSHTEGCETQTVGPHSHAEGYKTTAGYFNSYVEIGAGSHAEGRETSTHSDYSHTEGYQTQTWGDYAHAEGVNNNALGEGSHAEGYNTTAEGVYSHAEGLSTYAGRDGAHTEGSSTQAYGLASHAEGFNTIATAWASHVSGRYNLIDLEASDIQPEGKYVTIIGNGTDENNRSNAYTLDWNGNAWFAGCVSAQGINLPTTYLTLEPAALCDGDIALNNYKYWPIFTGEAAELMYKYDIFVSLETWHDSYSIDAGTTFQDYLNEKEQYENASLVGCIYGGTNYCLVVTGEIPTIPLHIEMKVSTKVV